MIVPIPRNVAKPAPSGPHPHGTNMTSRMIPTTRTSTATTAPNLELSGPNEPPKSIPNRSTMYSAAR